MPAAWESAPMASWSDAPLVGQSTPPAPKSAMDSFLGTEGGTTGLRNFVGKNAVVAALHGAGDIGATLQHYINPAEWGNDAADKERRAGMAAGAAATGADPNSLIYKGVRTMTQAAGTAGVGAGMGELAGPILSKLAPVIGPRIASALASNGFTTGAPVAATRAAAAGDLAIRSGAGAATGYAQVGAVDPSQATTGGVIGGLLPPGVKAAGMAGMAVARKAGNALADMVSPEVKALASRAKELGIDVPVDRILNSKPLNALASSLNYVPMSGRSAVERNMEEQMNRHLSTLVGQNSPNMTMALRKASGDLGAKFETTLQNNTVKVDPQFMTDLADAANKASKELGSDGASIIGKQVDDIVSKAGSGEIDGQAAYNIKKTLDRISNRNSPEAYYAGDLKRALMGALDRSLGPEQSAAFKTVREQYGNMLDLQKLAKNGAEGDISIARLANMKDIGNPKMQEAADIAAQFLKARESAHGSAQRAFLGAGAVGVGHMVPGAAIPLAATAAAGRGTNMLLNSNAARNMLMGQATGLSELGQTAGPSVLRAAPRLGNQLSDRR